MPDQFRPNEALDVGIAVFGLGLGLGLSSSRQSLQGCCKEIPLHEPGSCLTSLASSIGAMEMGLGTERISALPSLPLRTPAGNQLLLKVPSDLVVFRVNAMILNNRTEYTDSRYIIQNGRFPQSPEWPTVT